MTTYRTRVLTTLSRIGPRYLPFADVATVDAPLSRLMRLSLFQVSVGMALVLMVGTLNRVMIVELNVPASLVSLMIALPILFAPFRALIGHRSDTHRSALGLRRIPYLLRGTMLQFGGFALMPFALLVLSGYGESSDAPIWLGHGSAAIAFLLVGAGVHMVQTVGLALATDMVAEEEQPKVVGLMYVSLLLGMIVSAVIFGALLADYSPGRLIRVIQGAAVATLVLNGLAIWKQEGRDRERARTAGPKPGFRDAWRAHARTPGAVRLLIAIALGTFGFGMADVLLEPYGGQILGLTVAETTTLTAALAGGGLIGFAIASRVLGRGARAASVALWGAAAGLPGFAAIIASSALGDAATAEAVFTAGVAAIGFGAGLFSHGTLTAAMRAAPKEGTGLALGAWGAAQATAAGAGVAVGGVVRDLIFASEGAAGFGAEAAYLPVFAIEMAFLVLALVAVLQLKGAAARPEAPQP